MWKKCIILVFGASISGLIFDNFSDSVLEALARDVGDKCVHFFLGFLIFIPLAGKPHTHTVGDISDALRPDELIELDVYTHVRCAHRLSGKGLDLL